MRIFLVDDSFLILERMRRLLQGIEGFEIIGETGDTREAIAAIRREKPDAVLLDIHLLGGSGIDVLNAVKKDGKGPVVIVLTNYDYPQYRDKSLRAGADYFFVKSTEFDRVIPTLQEIRRRAGSSDFRSSGGKTSAPA